MAILVCCENSVPEGHFLRSKLGVDSFSELFLSQRFYGEILDNSTLFDVSEYVIENPTYIGTLSQDVIQVVLKDPETTLTDITDILYYNPAYYCGSEDALSELIDRLLLVKEASFILSKDSVVACKVPMASLSDYSELITPLGHEAQYQVSEDVVSLLDVQSLLGVFSSEYRSRHFNTVVMDEYYIEKTSDQVDKIRAEYHFLSTVPTPLKPFFPQVGEFSYSETSAHYQIERVACFDMGRLMIQGTLDAEKWGRFLHHVDRYLDLCPSQDVNADAYRNALNTLFIEKLKTRFEQLKTCSFYQELNTQWMSVTQESITDFVDRYCSRFESRINDLVRTELKHSHGELCFSNMLFDPEMDLLKLIDPRGSSDEAPPWMPVWYDIAKLSHSINGQYDLIVHDLMTVQVNKALQFELHPDVECDYSIIQTLFREWLNKRGFEVALVRLCEASLFLSMLPLHADSPDRVMAQLLAAKKAFDASLEGESV
jgi:thiamine kinase-like enzyme